MSQFLLAASEHPQEPAVRTDDAKRTLLLTKIQTLLQGVPRETPPDQIDIFALAVHIRADLPEGLAADDFDGNDVQNIVAGFLAPAANEE